MARRKAAHAEQKKHAPEHRFFNRDESWLRFNGRVLEEARDGSNPLLERLKFLSITASNLDEFIEVRVAAVLQRIEDGFTIPLDLDDDGLSEQERLDRLADQLHHFVHAQYACWTRELLPALATERIQLLRWHDLDAEAKAYAERFYRDEVDPLLTPVTIDPSHPFPRVLNKALTLALFLRRKRSRSDILGVLTVPRSLRRMVQLPAAAGEYRFLPLHELIEAHATRLFPGYQVLACSPFRVTRNSNLYLQEEESRSLLESVREELHNRRRGDVVRLEIEAGTDEAMLENLRTSFDLDRWQIFRTDGQVNLTRVAELYDAVDRPDLKFPKFQGRDVPLDTDSSGNPLNIFETLRNRDLLLHHPFDSYGTVERFMQSAAHDPNVVSIKQTLYRTSSNSPLFQALLEAAPTTDVTVIVELMARFDEDSNIRWARSLEDAGVQVYHGLIGHKTHAKLALLVRRDPDGVTRRYAHLGTGNYNSVTARFYTDVSFLTAQPDITLAVSRVFNYLTAQTEQPSYRPLLVAPITLAQDLLDLIGREAEHARKGRPARIIAKMNALLDGKTVNALYEASSAGVEIDLIVRGMCSLRPGLRGMSEHIRVRSIVGRFLEHSRIFFFQNGSTAEFGTPADTSEVYCGSADWMPRNLYDRCEAVFPVTAGPLRARLRNEILETYLLDNVKARLLQSSGEYSRTAQTGPPVSAQNYFMQLAEIESAKIPSAAPRPTDSAVPKPQDSSTIPTAKPAKSRSRSRVPGR